MGCIIPVRQAADATTGLLGRFLAIGGWTMPDKDEKSTRMPKLKRMGRRPARSKAPLPTTVPPPAPPIAVDVLALDPFWRAARLAGPGGLAPPPRMEERLRALAQGHPRRGPRRGTST